MRNESITLVVKSASGATVSENTYEVWAEKKSVARSEFYAAYQVGLAPKYVFVVSTDDWLDILDKNGQNEPTELIYGSRRFNIIRSFETFASVEVTCG